MLKSWPSRVPLDVWQSGVSLESTMPSQAHSRSSGSERHSSATLSEIGCAPIDGGTPVARLGTGEPRITFSPTCQLVAYAPASYSTRPPSCLLSQSMPTRRVGVATRSPLSGMGAPPPAGALKPGVLGSTHARFTRCVEQKTTSPGATRPTCSRWCSGTTRAYGMSAFEPFHCRLYDARIVGARTWSPGVLVRPRKAGRPPGTEVGRLGASRL